MGDQGKLHFMRTAGGLTHHNALRKKITSVTITRLVFLDDHKMLTDIPPESDDWGAGGTKYVDKQGGAHWLAGGESYPASVTKATRLSIEVDIAVESADADPIECVITATPSLKDGDSGAPGAFTFRANVVLGGAPVVRVAMEAAGPMADYVHLAVDWRLTWTVDAAARTFSAGETGPHRLYVTYATPEPGGKPVVDAYEQVYAAPLEDGITDKRMHAAVDLIERLAPEELKKAQKIWNERREQNELKQGEEEPSLIDPHVLVGALMTFVKKYTLRRPRRGVPAEDARRLEQYNHPKYVDDNHEDGTERAGAWPIYEYSRYYAECQAIVRFVSGVILQAGVPGDASYVVVYADADLPGGPTVVREDSIHPPDQGKEKYRWNRNTRRYENLGGLGRSMGRKQAGRQETQSLAGIVVEGPWRGEFPPPIPSGDTFNNFEACLKYRYGSTET